MKCRICIYDKCSQILYTLIVSHLSYFRSGIHKMLVRIAKREDPDQTASAEAV